MKVDHLVYDVMEAFIEDYTIFPLQSTFSAVAEEVTAGKLDTFSQFKECARRSVSLLAEPLRDAIKTAKPTARSMQAFRVAVRVFSILDLCASRYGLKVSKECANDRWVKNRCKTYDQNAQSIRYLYGTLPVWEKQFPALAITYLRCAVKVAQRRFRKATANLEGEEFLQVFTDYEIGETTFELERLCDKIEHHLRSLTTFVESNCIIPEADPSAEVIRRRDIFHDALKLCRTMVLQFNKILPILYVVNRHSKDKFKDAWREEIGEHEGCKFQSIDPENIGVGTRFVDFSPDSTRDLIGCLRGLHRATKNKEEALNDIAEAQISVIASSEVACATIARINNPDLNALAHKRYEREGSRGAEHTEMDDTLRELRSGAQNEQKNQNVTLRIRNSHLQSDLFCTWCSIIISDSYLEDDLVAPAQASSASLQMSLPDEWYELLISNVVVPDLVTNAFMADGEDNLLTASSRIMRMFAEKNQRNS